MRNVMASSTIQQQQEFQTSAKNQYLAACIVSGVASTSIGTVLGFSAILLPQLDDEGLLNSKSPEASWIASLSNIGQLFGSVFMGVLAGAIGRKKTIMALCFPLLIGWAILGFSKGDVKMLCLGRVLQGIGIMSSVTQVYLVEVADAQRRGMFGGSGALSVSAGITLVYTLGATLPNWRWVCVTCGAIPIAIFLLMPMLPETPNWLIMKGKRDEAYEAIRWLRGDRHDIEGEIKALEQSQRKSEESGSGAADGQVDQKFSTLHELRKPSAFKPFLLLIGVFVLMQLTGTYAVIFYAVNVFQDLEVASDPYIAAILVGLIRLIGSFLGTLLLKKFKRKVLMMSSAILMALMLAALAATVYYKDKIQQQPSTSEEEEASKSLFEKGLVYALKVLPLAEMILYILFFGLGVGTVPWLLLGELCPVKVKGLASGVVACAAFGTIFLLVKLFPMMLSQLGQHGTYLFFAAVCIVLILFTHLFVPETSGKSMAELQTLFQDPQEAGHRREMVSLRENST